MALWLWCWTLVDMQRIQKQIESTKNKGNLDEKKSLRFRTEDIKLVLMATCGPGSTTRDFISEMPRQRRDTAGSRSKRIQGRSWRVSISAVATGFSWLAHPPTTLGALKNPPRKECVCKRSCKKKTRESLKSAKIKSTQTQMKNRQEKHGRHSERIRKA